MLKSRLAKKEYLFRRTFFMISDDVLVELVALLKEPNQYTYTELHESSDTIAIVSREMKIAALPRRKAKLLLNNEYLIEQHPINHYQFNYLVSSYQESLLDVTNELLEHIKKGR
ncbi:hypothetical protein [Paucisalibacillus globulus]|uniref:hypothetical protein n=1 Tax=Paucisalibacillus globulus TaxID=351095 RepID=UPI0004262889|nr:hypothetical protein [Paucisalibacillus globulus]